MDFDRTWFGGPAADWTIRTALTKPDERTAIRDSYGVQESSAARWRQRLYEARHPGAIPT